MKAEPSVFDVVLLTPGGQHAIRVRPDEHIWTQLMPQAFLCLHFAIKGIA